MNGIRQFRLKAGLTQKQLADKLDVTQSAIAHWEAGMAMPSTANLLALSKLLGCTVEQLLTG